jgi:ABC-type proline/glycine betaine transport system permease subunit
MDRRSRVLARVFTVCGVLLLPWIWLLVEQLHGQAARRSLSSSWVGLDVLEAVCLITVAWLMRRRHRATSPAAAATAAVFALDAWSETMSAVPQLAYAESLAMACLAELPLAALLAWTAWFCLGWAAPAGRAGQ